MNSTHMRKTDPSCAPRILITGVGNVLRHDDGFGVVVVQELQKANKLPENVALLETGIAGIRLVQELFDDYDFLMVIDAVQRGGDPGQLYLLEADVPSIDSLSFDQRSEFLADMHFTNPTRAMMLAKALNILPPQVFIVGCESERHDDFGLGLSAAVAAALPKAVYHIHQWVYLLSERKTVARLDTEFCAMLQAESEIQKQ